MKSKYLFGLFVAVVLLPAVAYAQQLPNFDALFPASNGRDAAARGNAVTDLADAAKAALSIADQESSVAAEPNTRQASYAARLQDAFSQRWHPVPGNIIVPFAQTTDSSVLTNEVFNRNTRSLFISLAQSDRELANKKYADVRVIGGSPIPDAVDVVALVGSVGNNYTEVCSGAMISRTRILTAAHCVCNGAAQSVRAGQQIFGIEGYTSYFVSKTYLYGQTPAQSNAQRAQSDYCPKGNSSTSIEQAVAGRDLAIVETVGSISNGKPREVVGPAAFLRWQSGQYKYFVRAVGYGFSRIDANGNPASIGNRLFADVAVASYDCTDLGAVNFTCRAGNELVAAGRPLHQVAGPVPDTCGGDSGGPIYIQVDDKGRSVFKTIGITSRGTNIGCGAGGIYALTATAEASAWLTGMGATIRDDVQ